MKDYIDYTDKEAKLLRKIKKNEVQTGDYADVDGDGGFCYGAYNRITEIITRYNETTGKPYKVICCGDNQYRFNGGHCIKGALAYSIVGYYRLDLETASLEDKCKFLNEFMSGFDDAYKQPKLYVKDCNHEAKDRNKKAFVC